MLNRPVLVIFSFCGLGIRLILAFNYAHEQHQKGDAQLFYHQILLIIELRH